MKTWLMKQLDLKLLVIGAALGWAKPGVSMSLNAGEQVLVSASAVCKNMVDVFQSVSSQPLGAARLNEAQNLTGEFIDKLKAGAIKEYFALADLNGKATQSHDGVYSVASILQFALQSPTPFLLTYDVNDLKFLPYIGQFSHVLLVIDNANELTPERARVVAAVARQRQIHISVVWRGPSRTNEMQPTASEVELKKGETASSPNSILEGIVVISGGKFFDLNAVANRCSDYI